VKLLDRIAKAFHFTPEERTNLFVLRIPELAYMRDLIRSSLSHFEDHFEFDRRVKRKACYAEYKPERILPAAKHIAEQLGSCISDLGWSTLS
jgi:hypothetical protein